MIVITCECGKRLKAEETWAGRRVKCPDCGAATVVPGGQPTRTRRSKKTRRCRGCQTEYAADVFVCTNCGINLVTGEHYAMSVDHMTERASARAASEGKDPPAGAKRLLIWTAEYFPGLFRPVVLLGSLVLAAVGLAVVGLGLALFLAGVLLGGTMILGAGCLAYAQAAAFILSGEFETLVSALVDFDGLQWTIWFMLLFTPGSALMVTYMILRNAGHLPG